MAPANPHHALYQTCKALNEASDQFHTNPDLANRATLEKARKAFQDARSVALATEATNSDYAPWHQN